ncbi:FAD/NAD(P)-binding domain-containing protein [Cylindrobasidium torrendii FP15055 ss-10]|uniref:FAD/NAD(P)-binding domain-containing protein n=1 Tax=Cylindrobasidium torrendii FP15055 ss-10 TaxID=1314674 RepID=A0A0D7BCZ0_9AGAR|nr:FAD/NAD(P)-binding domain-containing protein [Cylindrobasidium torrendii FP15055 ss-10]
MTGSGVPTFEKLGIDPFPADIQVDAYQIASKWLSSFTQALSAGDTESVTALFVEGAYWRDLLALTWDFRTFVGIEKIAHFVKDRVGPNTVSAFSSPQDAALQRPYPDTAWIYFTLTFKVNNVGTASSIVRLVPQKDGVWRCHCLLTDLDELEGFPEKTGHLRNANPNHGLWESQRQKEIAFEDRDPTVLIVGAGQTGLMTAARLKYLGVDVLIVDKNERVGDNWRSRYDALCLHDTVWYDHMPYLPFPSTWPIFSPARKFAGWLEFYAEALELNVWMSTTVKKVVREEDGKWVITVQRKGTSERTLRVNHLVSASGLAATSSGNIKIPEYPGMEKFKGVMVHSYKHKRADDYIGKKVVVVGSGTSAHDICSDFYRHGVDVTMYQRGSTYVISGRGIMRILALYSEDGPPPDVADKMNASFPNALMEYVGPRQVLDVEETFDKPLLDGLRARGFKLNRGYKDSAGLLLQAWARGGGYYIGLDVGGSQLIIDGHVKLKNDSLLKEFTEHELIFEDGSKIEADVVVFSTGIGEAKDGLRNIVGDEIADKCGQVWGLDEEGEIAGVWRDLGFKGLWVTAGNLSSARYFSRHLALQIKAMEEGIFGERYALKSQHSDE